jgi:hypothetical protein
MSYAAGTVVITTLAVVQKPPREAASAFFRWLLHGVARATKTTARRRGESIRRAVVRLRRVRRSEGAGEARARHRAVGGWRAERAARRQNERLPATELPVGGGLVLEQPDRGR